MPNWVRNLVKIDTNNPEDVNKVALFVNGDESPFDFERIIPSTVNANEDSYLWHVDHWGTKWNSTEVETYDGNIFSFLTAWCPPTPVIKRLSEIFPEIKFVHFWADEDYGYNFGAEIVNNGKHSAFPLPKEGSKDAVKFARYVHDFPDLSPFEIIDC